MGGECVGGIVSIYVKQGYDKDYKTVNYFHDWMMFGVSCAADPLNIIWMDVMQDNACCQKKFQVQGHRLQRRRVHQRHLCGQPGWGQHKVDPRVRSAAVRDQRSGAWREGAERHADPRPSQCTADLRLPPQPRSGSVRKVEGDPVRDDERD